jgi:hypothetical protein
MGWYFLDSKFFYHPKVAKEYISVALIRNGEGPPPDNNKTQ